MARNVTIAAVLVFATACNDDGRELRPAAPDKTASVSTTAPTTLPPSIPDDPFDVGSTAAAPTTQTPLPTAVGTTLPGSVDTAVEVAPEAPQLVAPWVDGGDIDAQYTCDGENVSPALVWSPAPAGTVEIAVAMTDEDLPGFVHWVIAALDPLSTSLGEGRVPQFAVQAVASSGTAGYFGPCPPAGETHRYRLTVYYLGQQTELGDGAPAADLLTAVQASAFDSSSVTGTYSRS